MTYDAEAGKYVFNQYGQVMKDQITDETEMFTNVIIMNTQISTTGIYHIADFNAGGTRLLCQRRQDHPHYLDL